MLLRERLRRKAEGKLFTYYPGDGPLSRDKYKKHMEFFEAGAVYKERCFMAANRVGKTEGAGGYELTLHLTGLYPDWWEGRRFNHPVRAWAAGKTGETVRDIIQYKLLGPFEEMGTGLIPADRIKKFTRKSGISEAVDTIKVAHSTNGCIDGYSILGLKTFSQGRGGFEGTEQHVVWLDEEAELEIYDECLMRTVTTKGIIMLTFTPLCGISRTVRQFLPKKQRDTE